ncbi:MAG: ABC transporter permease [Desulfobacterales bacterium]|nr:ABC transporter permease [Desulfobacterales bacterium]
MRFYIKTKKIALQYNNIVPIVFFFLSLAGLYFSKMDISFVVNEVIVRFIRDGVMVLSLIIPITAGMGLNFAIIIGAICAQIGLLIILDFQIGGALGLCFAIIIGVIFAIFLGTLIGISLNRATGKEMIATIIMGFLATGIYQYIFLVGYGTFLPFHNNEIILSRGVGIRSMVDLSIFRNTMDKLWQVQIGSIQIPFFMILTVFAFALVIKYITGTKLGQEIKTVGYNHEKAELLGIDVYSVRIKAIIISTVTACIGQIIFIQNIGMLNVYTAHLNSDIFSCAALLAGGASIKKAKIRHAFLGIFLFHTLFIVSPQAGQNIFSNASIGEYFRSFIAYGAIAFALMTR